MRVIKTKIVNVKINNNIKIIFIMTLTIFTILIILPFIFLEKDESFKNIFSVNSSSVAKESAITFPISGKVKLYRKSENKVEEMNLEDYIMGGSSK